jgi:hypothetical protein
VSKRVQAALGGERGERRLLVVAALRQAFERVVVEDVDPAADPVGQPRRLAEPAHDVLVGQVDHAEGAPHRHDGDRRRGPALAMAREQRRKVDVDELVAVQRVHRA